MSCQYWIHQKKRLCSLKGKDEYMKDDKLYCKRHYTILCNSKDDIFKPTKEKTQCMFILISSKKQCSFSSTSEYNNVHYCTRHYKKIISNNTLICKHDSCESFRKETSSYCDHHLHEKEEYNEVQKLIKELTSLSLSKNVDIPTLKKKYFKILLKVHPDKCKNSMIQSHEVTQNINKIMNTFK